MGVERALGRARPARWLTVLGGAGGLSAGWALVVLGGALAIHLRIAAPGGAHMRGTGPAELVRDEGTVLYDALRWSRGEVMYRDFFEFHTPLFYAAHALLFAALGPSLRAARVLAALVAALAAVLLADLVARRAGRLAALGAAALHVFVLFPLWPLAYPHWWAELLALGTLWCLVARPPGAARQLATGGLSALAALTIQSVGLPLLGAVLAVETAESLSRGPRARALLGPLRVLAGALLAAAPFVAYLGAHGALADAVRCTWTWPIERYAEGNQDAAQYSAYLERFVRAHAALPHGLAPLAELLLTLVAALPVAAMLLACGAAAGRLLPRGPTEATARPTGALVACAALVAPALASRTRTDLTHLAFLASFGLVALALAASRTRRPWVTAALAVWLAQLGAGGALLHGHKSLAQRRDVLPATFHEALRATAERYWGYRGGVLSWVDAEVPRDAPIVVGSLEGYVYFFERPAAVSFTALPSHRADDYLDDAQWRRLADEIARRRPAVALLLPYQWGRLAAVRPGVWRAYDDWGVLRARAPAGTQPGSGSVSN